MESSRTCKPFFFLRLSRTILPIHLKQFLCWTRYALAVISYRKLCFFWDGLFLGEELSEKEYIHIYVCVCEQEKGTGTIGEILMISANNDNDDDDDGDGSDKKKKRRRRKEE